MIKFSVFYRPKKALVAFTMALLSIDAWAADTGRGANHDQDDSAVAHSSSTPSVWDPNAKSISFQQGDYSFERLMEEGPILDTEQKNMAQQELQRISANSEEYKRLKCFIKARQYSIKDMIRLGGKCIDQEDLPEAFKWYALAVGCSVVKRTAGISAEESMAFKYLSDLNVKFSKKITELNEKIKRFKKGRKNKKNKEIVLIKELKKKFVSHKQKIDFLLEDRPVGNIEEQIHNYLHNIADGITCGLNNDFYYYKIKGFIGLVSNVKSFLSEMAEEMCLAAYEDYKIKEEHVPIMSRFELYFLKKMDDMSAYHKVACSYYSLGAERTPKNPEENQLVFVRGHLSQGEACRRALYYFGQIPAEDPNFQKASYNTGCMYYHKFIGNELSDAERLEILEDFFRKANMRQGYILLGLAYNQAAKATDLDLDTAKRYFQRAVALLGLGSNDLEEEAALALAEALEGLKRVDDAKEIYEKLGTASALHKLALLYVNDERLDPYERYKKSVELFQKVRNQNPNHLLNNWDLAIYSSHLVTQSQIEEEKETYSSKTLEMLEKIFQQHFELPPICFYMAAICYYRIEYFEKATQYATIALAAGIKDAQRLLDTIDFWVPDSSSNVSDKEDVVDGTDSENEPSVLVKEEKVPDADVGVVVVVDSETQFGEVAKEEGPVSFPDVDEAEVRRLPKRDKQFQDNHEEFQREFANFSRRDFSALLEEQNKVTEWEFEYHCDIPDNHPAKVKELTEDIRLQPWGLYGSGQPEILKGSCKKYGIAVYSRRINNADRLTYVLDPESKQVHILTAEGHYDKAFHKAVKKYLSVDKKVIVE